MVKARGILRTYPGGAAASGKVVTITLEADDSEITTDTTDSEGVWDYVANGSPGGWRWSATDATPDPDVTRASSTLSYGGGGTFSLYELPFALRALGDGVVSDYGDELEVTYDASGLDLDIGTGAALGAGIPFVAYDDTHLTSVGTRDATNPKACYIVVEISPPGQSDEGRSEIKAVCGTAAASPTLPSLTNDETLRQIALASYRLPNTSSTTLTLLTDVREFVLDPANLTRNPIVSSIVRRTDPTSETTTTSTTGASVTSLTSTLTLVSGVIYDVEVRGFLTSKISSSGQTVSMAVYGNGTSEIGAFIASNSTDYIGLANVHTVAGITGTGSTISVGMRWRVSGGVGTANTGYLLATAVPRS